LAEFVAQVQHNPKYRVEHRITEINNESVVADNVIIAPLTLLSCLKYASSKFFNFSFICSAVLL